MWITTITMQIVNRVYDQNDSPSATSASDTILMKLKWGREAGGSEQQFHDALRVYEVQHGVLQLDYLQQWASLLGLAENWQRLLAEARPLDP